MNKVKFYWLKWKIWVDIVKYEWYFVDMRWCKCDCQEDEKFDEVREIYNEINLFPK